MDAPIDQESVVRRINPGAFSHARIESEAGEIEVRLSRHGNWIVHLRPADQTDWKVACCGDMDSGALAFKPIRDQLDGIRFGPLSITPRERQVLVDDEVVALTAKEFGLLVMLAGDPYRLFTKEELMMAIWGYYLPGSSRALESQASRLRRKLASAGAVRLVVNVWGLGYRLCDPMYANAAQVEARAVEASGVRSERSDLAPAA